MRCGRRISQRELAEVAHIPRTTIARIEGGATIPRFDTLVHLAAALGYVVSIHDRHRRPLHVDADKEALVDRGGRHFPAHLRADRTPGYFAPIEAGNWWGWHNIAWPFTDDWVPEHTYWQRVEWRPIEGCEYPGEWGRVWDDAT